MVLLSKELFGFLNYAIFIGYMIVNIYITYNIVKTYGALLGKAMSTKNSEVTGNSI